MDVKRGDIVYVEIPYATGHEMMKDRPAVVVSNNAQNYAGEVVSVIYMTGSLKASPWSWQTAFCGSWTTWAMSRGTWTGQCVSSGALSPPE